MRVLVACEFSGIVRDAFRRRGHDAVSCDLLDTEQPGPHIKGDMFDALSDGWDIVIAHPPCTAIAVSGNRWYAGTQARLDAIRFVERIWQWPGISRLCVENPVGVLPAQSCLGPATQYVQPWQFGHGETKRTGLWLRGLPLLRSTNVVDGRIQRIWKMPPGPGRAQDRSRTYTGIAEAMAEQWGQP